MAGWTMAKMHKECERRLDIIKGNDRLVQKISNVSGRGISRGVCAHAGPRKATETDVGRCVQRLASGPAECEAFAAWMQ